MSQEGNALPEAIASLFAAYEVLYHVTLAEMAAGHLAANAESPQRLAFSVAMLALQKRVLCPEWAAGCVSQAWERFEHFECQSLGEAFGIPDHKHAQAKRTKGMLAIVYGRVRYYRAKGSPLKDSTKGKGALALVGEEFCLSAKQVEKMLTDWRKLCRECGQDPDATPGYADATEALRKAWARGWRGDA